MLFGVEHRGNSSRWEMSPPFTWMRLLLQVQMLFLLQTEVLPWLGFLPQLPRPVLRMPVHPVLLSTVCPTVCPAVDVDDSGCKPDDNLLKRVRKRTH